MKSENQTIVWCNQLIKIEKPWQQFVVRLFQEKILLYRPLVVNPWPAGGEVHVSFEASSQTHSTNWTTMPNCPFGNGTINFNTYELAWSNFHVSTISENSKDKIS